MEFLTEEKKVGLDDLEREKRQNVLCLFSVFQSHMDNHGYRGSLKFLYPPLNLSVEDSIELLGWASESRKNAYEIALDYLFIHARNLLYSKSTTDEGRHLCSELQKKIKELTDDNTYQRIEHIAPVLLSDPQIASSIHRRNDISPGEFVSKFGEILKRYQRLVTGEWAMTSMSAGLSVLRQECAYEQSKINREKISAGDAQMGESASLFLSDECAKSCRSNAFYDITSSNPIEAYQALVYQMGYDLFTNPLSVLNKEYTATGGLVDRFFPSFFRVSPFQIQIAENLAQSRNGKGALYTKDLSKDKKAMPDIFSLGTMIYTEKKECYADKEVKRGSFYTDISLLEQCLEKEYKNNIMLDPRYVLLCHFLSLPQELSPQEKTLVVFGSLDQDVKTKVEYLLDFYERPGNKENTVKVLIAHELKSYLPNHSAEEIFDLMHVIDFQTGANCGDQVIQLFDINPEAALVLLGRKELKKEFVLSPGGGYTKKTYPLVYRSTTVTPDSADSWITEGFLKSHEKDILELRFGKKKIRNRDQMAKDMRRVITKIQLMQKDDGTVELSRSYPYQIRKGPKPW